MIIAPTFDNARTLPALLAALHPLEFSAIVVNDGSRDETASILANWLDGSTNRQVVRHEANRGKAAALQSGFARAIELGFTHAVTIDTDGQHDVADILPLIASAREHSQSLILGTRVERRDDSRADHPPICSRVGRAISNHFVWLESGAIVADSQCGLRIYPLEIVRQLRAHAGRYGYETEVLTRFAWCGGSIVQVPIRSIYDIDSGRTTHFRLGRDSLAAVVMHARLVSRSLLPWPVPRLVESQPPTQLGTIIDRLSHWMNPLRIWRDLRANQSNRKRFATAMASGVALAALPPYGLKTIPCLIVAKRFKLDSAVMIAASSLNTPPIGPLLAAAGIFVGHSIRYGSLPTWSNYDPAHLGVRTMLCAVGMDWLVGSLVVAASLATLVYFLARFSLNIVPLEAKRAR